MLEAAPALSESEQRIATEVAWAIGIASYKLPLRVVCIHQAITAKQMLSERGTPNTLYLGARKGDAGKIGAHAWVVSGNTPITGAAGFKDFSIISSFA